FNHVETWPPFRPEKPGVGLAGAASITDDRANGCVLRLCPTARRGGNEQDRPQQYCGRAAGEAIATAPGHDDLHHAIRTSLARLSRRPLLDDGGERVEAVRQRRRPRLQDERRLDLAQKTVAHGGDFGETRPRRDFLRYKLFAAPGADDDLGIGADHILGRYNALLGVLAPG